jgi:hypothetical protein
MAEIERVKVCIQCKNEYRERANIGRLMCRMHPDYTPTDSFRRAACCGYRPGDDGATYSKTVTLADRAGCLMCDHSSDVPITDAPVVILACLLVEAGMVRPPMPNQIIEQINGKILRERIQSGNINVTLAVPMPSLLKWVDIGLVACAFNVLSEFVQSPYYEWSQYDSVKEARTRFESASKNMLVSTAWDTELDLRPDHDAFATNADDGEDDKSKNQLASSNYVPADRQTLGSSDTRLAIVKKVQADNMLDILCAMAVPFYVIRRVAENKDSTTLDHFATYNKTEATTWDTTMRDTRFSNIDEYAPV